MSFGFSAGDFVIAVQLVKSTLDNIRSAPADFNEAEQAVQAIKILLDSLKTEVNSPTSVFKRNARHGEQLKLLLRSCRPPLNKLNRILEKYPSLGSSNVKILDRIRFSKKAVAAIISELSIRYANLSAFLDTVGLAGIGRVEWKLDGVTSKVDNVGGKIESVINRVDHVRHDVNCVSLKVNTVGDKIDNVHSVQVAILQAVENSVAEARLRQDTASILSDHTDDDKIVWKQLRRELNRAGFKSADIERHKDQIFWRLTDLQACDLSSWDASSMVGSNVSPLAHSSMRYQPPTAESVLDDSGDDYGIAGREIHQDASSYLRDDAKRPVFRRNDRGSVQGVRNKAQRESGRQKMPRASDSAYHRSSLDSGIDLPIADSRTRNPRYDFQETKTNFKSASDFRSTDLQTNATHRRTSTDSEHAPRGDISGTTRSNVQRGRRGEAGDTHSSRMPAWRYRKRGDELFPGLLDHDLDHGVLIMAVIDEDIDKITSLLGKGADIEVKCAVRTEYMYDERFDYMAWNDGSVVGTPLFWAVSLGSLQTSHLLLRYGANPNAHNGTRKDSLLKHCVLHPARSNSGGEPAELIRLLLEYGANARDSELIVPVAGTGYCVAMEIFLQYGADIDSVLEAATPLFMAARCDQVQMVRLLVSKGAHWRGADHQQQSPLLAAIANNNADMVSLLLSCGADPNELYPASLFIPPEPTDEDEDHRPWSLLHAAIIYGGDDEDPSIVNALVDHGADINALIKGDMRPIDVAANLNQEAVVAYLYEAHKRTGVRIYSGDKAKRGRVEILARAAASTVIATIMDSTSTGPKRLSFSSMLTNSKTYERLMTGLKVASLE